MVLLGSPPQFAHGPALDLPDAFFGNPHRGSDLLQPERLLAADEAKTTGDNLSLPLVESVKQRVHMRHPLDLRRLLLVVIGRTSATLLNISWQLVRNRSR